MCGQHYDGAIITRQQYQWRQTHSQNVPSILIWDGIWLLRIDLVQYGGEDTPGLCQLVRPYKVNLCTGEHVHQEALIGIWHFYTL